MKNSLIAALMTLAASPAFASWYQVECSNADRTVSSAMGHSRNGYEFTIHSWDNSGMHESRFTAGGQEIDAKVLKSRDEFNQSHTGCRPGEAHGWYSSLKVTYQQVELRKKDGSAFPKETVGVSNDGKVVTAHLICQQQITSETLCPNR